MDLPKRKQLRLTEYDYSSPGAYFVTICTQDRRCILSEIRRGDPCGRPPTWVRVRQTGGQRPPLRAETSSSLRRGDLCVARMSP